MYLSEQTRLQRNQRSRKGQIWRECNSVDSNWWAVLVARRTKSAKISRIHLLNGNFSAYNWSQTIEFLAKKRNNERIFIHKTLWVLWIETICSNYNKTFQCMNCKIYKYHQKRKEFIFSYFHWHLRGKKRSAYISRKLIKLKTKL